MRHRRGIENAVRIEADAFASDGGREQQRPSRREDASQLTRRSDMARRIDRISIPSQADVLEHMETAQAPYCAARERQLRQQPSRKCQPRNRDREWSDVDIV